MSILCTYKLVLAHFTLITFGAVIASVDTIEDIPLSVAVPVRAIIGTAKSCRLPSFKKSGRKP
jgi:hypothetical protein